MGRHSRRLSYSLERTASVTLGWQKYYFLMISYTFQAIGMLSHEYSLRSYASLNLIAKLYFAEDFTEPQCVGYTLKQLHVHAYLRGSSANV